MTLKRSKLTGSFVAQCDKCFDFMDFEEDDNFVAITHILRASGWVPSKVRDKWTHWCPDCMKER